MFYMKQFNADFILPFNIPWPKHSDNEKLDSSKNHCQSLDSTYDKICVGNGIFLYFKDDNKLDLYYMVKIRYLVIDNNSSVLLIKWTEMNWKTSNVNGFCISIFFNKMGSYLGVIRNLHNDECLIYILTGKVENGTPVIFNKTLYHYWYK